MFCRRPEKKFWMLSLLPAVFVFFALPCMGFMDSNETFAATQAAAENYNSSSISDNQDEVVLSVKLLGYRNFAYIKLPQPEDFVLAEPSIKGHDTSTFTYTSNLDSWKKQTAKQTYIGDLRTLTVSDLGEQLESISDAEEAQDLFNLFLGQEVSFFGNIPDTYMGHEVPQNPVRRGFMLFGFTRINKAQVGVHINASPQEWDENHLEQYKRIMVDYLQKIRDINLQ